MWMEFFVVGGIWFWLLTGLLVVALIWETSAARPLLALFTLVFYGALLHLFGDALLFSTIKAHPEVLYIGLPCYFLAGAVWSIINWALYVKRRANKYREERQGFLIGKGCKEATLDCLVPDEYREDWIQWHGTRNRKPLVRRNKGMVLTWMGLWPVSVIDEPWRYIYDAIHNLLQRISDKIYAGTGYEQDLKRTKSVEE